MNMWHSQVPFARYILWYMHLHLRLIWHMPVSNMSYSGAVPLAAGPQGVPICNAADNAVRIVSSSGNNTELRVAAFHVL